MALRPHISVGLPLSDPPVAMIIGKPMREL